MLQDRNVTLDNNKQLGIIDMTFGVGISIFTFYAEHLSPMLENTCHLCWSANPRLVWSLDFGGFQSLEFVKETKSKTTEKNIFREQKFNKHTFFYEK